MTKNNNGINSYNRAKTDYSAVIRAFCSVYFASFVVETQTNHYQALDCPAWMQMFPMEGRGGDLANAAIDMMVLPEFREPVREFMRRDHIRRMLDQKNITEVKNSFYMDFKAARNDKVYWCRMTVILVDSMPDGAPKRILVVLQDVTGEKTEEENSRKNLEQQLEIVNALSRDFLNVFLTDSTLETVRILKLDGYVTKGFERNSEASYAYYPSCLRYIEGRVHPEDVQMMQQAMRPEVVRERLARRDEYVGSYRVLIDGEVHYFQFKYMRLNKSDRIIIGFQNVDEAVATEKRHREELQNALDNARRANLAKTSFLNNMSHDIRTPMNAILGYTTLAAEHMEDPERLQDYLAKITSSSNHLLALINDVLDMSRIESGRMKLAGEECSLAQIVHDIRDILRPDAEAHQLNFMIDVLDVVDECVICDKLRISQVLLNCASNAVKFTPPGGTVSIQIRQTPADREGYGNYRFVIRDTGIGMASEFLDHLFEPFTREENSFVNQVQGTGLGMAIVKNIVDMMGGSVEVKSTPGQGTQFTISLPLRLAGEKEECAGRIPELEGGPALVADSDVSTCNSIAGMLRSIGMQTEWTSYGEEALIHARRAADGGYPYRVVVTADTLPDGDGLDLIEQLRSLSQETRFVVCAADREEIRERAENAGISEIVEKPVFRSELLGALQKKRGAGDASASGFSRDYRGRRVLVVEDNELNSEIAVTILEEMGIAADTAGNGREAADLVASSPEDRYDLILMDVQMPVMNGYEATREIRTFSGRRGRIPVAAMSANAFTEDREKGRLAGMNEYLAKPVRVEELRGLLDRYLEGPASETEK